LYGQNVWPLAGVSADGSTSARGIRSAAYYAAPAAARRRAHAALAAVTDSGADPDQRAWHLAEAAAGPDEQVAAELERSAGRAQARGGLAAAAAFLEQAAALTLDPARRAGRTLDSAQASVRAGAFGKARDLLAAAEARPLDEFASARVDLLRGQIAFASGLGSDVPPLPLKAARRLEPLDLDLARQAYVDAWQAAIFASTVEYHLRKIFRKLGVSSRTQLARTLQHDQGTSAPRD